MTEQKLANRKRVTSGVYALLLVVVMVIASRWYTDVAGMLTGLDPTQIADLGPDIFGPAFISLAYASTGLLFGMFAGWILERSVKETSFGTWSRRAVGFVLGLWSFSHIAGSLL